jgi:nitrous oxidase accessory protein NosD
MRATSRKITAMQFPALLKVLLFCSLLSSSEGRILFVDLGGDDATAEADNPERPFGTLTNAFRALQNGDQMVIREGRYEIVPGFPTSYFPMPDYAPLRLENLTNVTITATGTAEIYGEGPGDFLMIQNCEDIRIEKLTFKGNRPNVPEDVHDPLFSTVLLRAFNNRLHFEECRFLDFGNHAISHLWGPKQSYNLVVTNCYFADGGDGEGVPFLNEDGAAISGIPSGSRIVNNRIERCFRGIEVEGAFYGKVTNVVIQGNVISDSHSLGIMLFATHPESQNRPDSYSDIHILDNTITNLYSHPDYSVRTQYGMMILGGSDLRIIGNRIENAPRGIGMLLSSSMMDLTRCLIMSNEVRNVAGRGIQVWQDVEQVKDVKLLGNRIYHAAEEGILLNGVSIECSENVVENSAKIGERGAIKLSNIGAGSYDALISDNIVRNDVINASYGIWIEAASNTVIYGNSFEKIRQDPIRDAGINTTFLAKIKAIEKTGSRASLLISGKPFAQYQLEISTDLGTWNAVRTNTCLETGLYPVDYIGEPGSNNEFFRVVPKN